jgi:hypothetical protein
MLVLTFIAFTSFQRVLGKSLIARVDFYFAPSGPIVAPRPALRRVLIFMFSSLLFMPKDGTL